MKCTIKYFITFFFCFFYTFAQQDKKNKKSHNYPSENNYLGYEMFWPNLKKGWKNNGPWIGPTLQAGYQNFYVRAGVGFGNAYNVKNDSVISSSDQYRYLGLLAKPKLHLLRNIVVIEPEIGLDFIYAGLKDPIENSNAGIGFGLCPGLGIKIGPLKVVGRQILSYNFSLFSKQNPWSKGMVFPVISIMLETGKGLLVPKKVKTSGWLNIAISEFEQIGAKEDVVEFTGDYTYYRNTYVTKIYRLKTRYEDKYFSMTAPVIAPFWYIAPYNSMSRVSNFKNQKTVLWGAELGLRYAFIALNTFYAKGNYGFTEPIPESVLISQYGAAPDLNGIIPSTLYGVDGGIDFFGLIFNSMRNNLDGYKWFNATLFVRFIVQYGYGKITFNGPAKYFTETAEQQLQNFYTLRPDLKPDNYGIPGKSGTSDFTRWSFRWEMGLVTLGYEKIKSNKSPYLNNRVFTLGFMIAPSRIYNKLKGMHYSKKLAEQIINENKK